jgi:hypothetical protein
LKALSSCVPLCAPGSIEPDAHQAPEPSVQERLSALEVAFKAFTAMTPYTDELEYRRAISALANGDRGKALAAYMKNGGRIPRHERPVCS